MNKTCSRCKFEKSIKDFCKRSSAKDGLSYWCNACKADQSGKTKDKHRMASSRYYETHKDKCKSSSMSWKNRNKDRVSKSFKKWYASYSPEKNMARRQRFIDSNPGIFNEYAMRRYAAKKGATPSWANKDAILNVYRSAVEISSILGKKFDVDHIVPLRSKNVCGLHVEHNLRIVPRAENLAKGNKLMPELLAA